MQAIPSHTDSCSCKLLAKDTACTSGAGCLKRRAMNSATHSKILQEKSPSTMTKSHGATFSQSASKELNQAQPVRNRVSYPC